MKITPLVDGTLIDASGAEYDFVGNEDVVLFDEIGGADSHSEVNAFLHKRHSRYGTSSIVLTDADIAALKSGKMIVWAQGEYASVIYYGEVADDDI